MHLSDEWLSFTIFTGFAAATTDVNTLVVHKIPGDEHRVCDSYAENVALSIYLVSQKLPICSCCSWTLILRRWPGFIAFCWSNVQAHCTRLYLSPWMLRSEQTIHSTTFGTKETNDFDITQKCWRLVAQQAKMMKQPIHAVNCLTHTQMKTANGNQAWKDNASISTYYFCRLPPEIDYFFDNCCPPSATCPVLQW